MPLIYGIFPISCEAAGMMVIKSGDLVGIKLLPHLK
jgi:hypothetical protein